MHVTSVSREEVEDLKEAFAVYDVDNDGRISVNEFSSVLKSMFEEGSMFRSMLTGVIRECKNTKWVYFPDLLATLVRKRGNPFYEEIWERFLALQYTHGLVKQRAALVEEFVQTMEFKNSLISASPLTNNIEWTALYVSSIDQ